MAVDGRLAKAILPVIYFVNYLSRVLKQIPVLGSIWLWFIRWLFPLDEASLMRDARRVTGLSDFGNQRFLVPFRLLLEDLEESADLHLFGRYVAREEIMRNLIGRLRLVDVAKKHPEINDVEVKDPVVILGLPRTGSTHLFDLLSLDTATFREPITWECTDVYPPPESSTYRTDSRIEKKVHEIELVDILQPTLQEKHPTAAWAPQECLVLMGYDFVSTYYSLAFKTPKYWKWFLTADLTHTYRFLRWSLKYLQWKNPHAPVWLLKCPSHLLHLKAFLTVFPDARFVITHRDPLRVICSLTALWSVWRNISSDDIDWGEIAGNVLPPIADGLGSMVELRQSPTSRPETGSQSDDDSAHQSGRPAAYQNGHAAAAAAGYQKSIDDQALTCFAFNTVCGDDCGCRIDPNACLDTSKLVDVMFKELITDSMNEVQRVYSLMGRELPEEGERAMREHLSMSKKKSAKYDWADIKQDRATERARFKFYMERFSIPEESIDRS